MTLDCRENILVALNSTVLNISAECNSTIVLNDSEFEYSGDNLILFRGELQFNTSQGQPAICVNFTQNGTINVTTRTYIYPPGYNYITYVCCSLSIIGCCLVMLTFCVFKDMRTLPMSWLSSLQAKQAISRNFAKLLQYFSTSFSLPNSCG